MEHVAASEAKHSLSTSTRHSADWALALIAIVNILDVVGYLDEVACPRCLEPWNWVPLDYFLPRCAFPIWKHLDSHEGTVDYLILRVHSRNLASQSSAVVSSMLALVNRPDWVVWPGFSNTRYGPENLNVPESGLSFVGLSRGGRSLKGLRSPHSRSRRVLNFPMYSDSGNLYEALVSNCDAQSRPHTTSMADTLSDSDLPCRNI